MTLSRFLMILVCAWFTTAIPFADDEPSRESRWNDDLDYLIERLEITHPNLYANISREAFLEHADRLRRSIRNSTDIEMTFGIQELVARIGNTHTLCKPVRFMTGPAEFKSRFSYYPIRYYPFQDGLHVVAASKAYAEILGKKVLRIGNLTVPEVMSELSRFVAGDNRMTKLGNIPRWCLDDGQLLHHVGASDSAQRVTLMLENDDGSVLDYMIEARPDDPDEPVLMRSLRARSDNPDPLYLAHPDRHYWFEYLPEHDAVYLQIILLYDAEEESFADFCRRLFATLDEKQATKLIVDVRLSPGGDHIELPLLKGILARPDLDRADRLFLIIGRLTGSAAQHLTSEFETYTNATLFGEATASKPNQYGAMQDFSLPNSGLEISCALKYFQDARPADYSISSEPDIHVPLYVDDLARNRDPMLERVLEYDSFKHLRPEFFAAMSEAYQAGGMVRFKEVYAGLKESHTDRGFNMEELLYHDLDGWMARNRKSDEDYIEFLRFIHGELPDSTSIAYDLAWWMNDSGNTAEAKALYRECLKSNPEHHHAKWRLGLIELEEQRQARHDGG